ncbi:hypothetical protein GCM10010335_67100 [Streptomyces galbus]|nr:hypothetical protein GCM10010335_67100 [Streptomyces galbus]
MQEASDRSCNSAVPETGAAEHGMVPIADKDHVSTGPGRSGPPSVVRGGAGAGHPIAFAVDHDDAFPAQLSGGFPWRKPRRQSQDAAHLRVRSRPQRRPAS